MFRRQARKPVMTVMVALVPSEEASKALLEHSGGTEPLDQQHITLVYLEVEGDEETRDQIANLVDYVALRYAPLNGEANGWGVFQNEQDVLVALWNIPGVNGLRQALVEGLREIGLAVKQDYGFTPHQTMAYAEPATGVKVPARLDFPVKSDFGHLVLSWGKKDGEDEWDYFPLSGVRKESAKEPEESLRTAKDYTRGGNPENPGQFSKQDQGHRKKDKDSKDPKGKSSPKGSDSQQAQGDDQDQKGAQEGQDAAQGAPEGQEGQEDAGTPAEPQEGYTGLTYDPTKDYFTPQERIAHGDAYGHFLPAGRYAEGDPRNEPEFERLMAEKTALTEKYESVTKEEIDAGATEGGHTEDLYDKVFPPGGGKDYVYTPERTKVHQEIIARLSETYATYPREGKAIVMAGPPGAGKSTFLSMYGEKEFGVQVKGKDEPKDAPPAKNFVTMNPDDFKELLPVDMSRYPGLEENEVAAMLHEESSYLAKIATRHFMSQGYNVIIDITLGSSKSAMKKYVTPFEEMGYDYQVALVDGTMANSLNNAGLRWKKPDKETGVRTYGGRFLKMSLIESNAPSEGSPFRSKNAEQFTEFIEYPGVSRAVVYNPDDQSIAEAKADGGVIDWLGQRGKAEPQEEDAPELAAAAALVRRVLSSILRAEGSDSMKRFASMKPKGTAITEQIVSYSEGNLDLDALVEFLVNYDYAPSTVCPFERGTPEWWQWHEDRGDEPGTYDEVTAARDYGLLSWEDFEKINSAMVASAKDEDWKA